MNRVVLAILIWLAVIGFVFFRWVPLSFALATFHNGTRVTRQLHEKSPLTMTAGGLSFGAVLLTP